MLNVIGKPLKYGIMDASRAMLVQLDLGSGIFNPEEVTGIGKLQFLLAFSELFQLLLVLGVSATFFRFLIGGVLPWRVCFM